MLPSYLSATVRCRSTINEIFGLHLLKLDQHNKIKSCKTCRKWNNLLRCLLWITLTSFDPDKVFLQSYKRLYFSEIEYLNRLLTRDSWPSKSSNPFKNILKPLVGSEINFTRMTRIKWNKKEWATFLCHFYAILVSFEMLANDQKINLSFLKINWSWSFMSFHKYRFTSDWALEYFQFIPAQQIQYFFSFYARNEPAESPQKKYHYSEWAEGIFLKS